MSFWQKLKLVFTDRGLRNRILFTLLALIIFRALAGIPVPGVNASVLENFLSQNQIFGILNILSGGGLSALSIVMLGVGPIITASIIMQLLTIMSPRLKSMYHEEGAFGREKFVRVSRYLSIPLGMIQAFGFLSLLENQGAIAELSLFAMITNILVVTAGSTFLMWLGDIITEKGIGNGTSVIIFAGILSSIPGSVSQITQAFDASRTSAYILFGLVTILVLALIVFVTEAERPIPISHSRQGATTSAGRGSYVPLRLNQAGVMPVIFAISVMQFPQIISGILTRGGEVKGRWFVESVDWFMTEKWAYTITLFFLVIIFTYFYTAITFDPHAMATNLQKNGAFVPGIRPGEQTASYVSGILSRTTLVGGVFLAVIAILPSVLQNFTGMQAMTIGGTSVLIVVSVILDILKKTNGQITLKQY